MFLFLKKSCPRVASKDRNESRGFSDEFATAQSNLKTLGEEVFFRVSGVIARIALERHLFTVAETHGIAINVNPPTKKKAEAQDVIISLKNASLITPIQQSQLETLFKIGNNCAHPKDKIISSEIESLVADASKISILDFIAEYFSVSDLYHYNPHHNSTYL